MYRGRPTQNNTKKTWFILNKGYLGEENLIFKIIITICILYMIYKDYSTRNPMLDSMLDFITCHQGK